MWLFSVLDASSLRDRSLLHGVVLSRGCPAPLGETCTGRLLPALFPLSREVPSITLLLSLTQLDLFQIPRNTLASFLFSPVLSEKFISAFERLLHRGKSASIIGMPLAFPWTLGLRALASLSAISFAQMWSWIFYIPDIVLLCVQGSSPTQILSRYILMSESSCVLPAHA